MRSHISLNSVFLLAVQLSAVFALPYPSQLDTRALDSRDIQLVKRAPPTTPPPTTPPPITPPPITPPPATVRSAITPEQKLGGTAVPNTPGTPLAQVPQGGLPFSPMSPPLPFTPPGQPPRGQGVTPLAIPKAQPGQAVPGAGRPSGKPVVMTDSELKDENDMQEVIRETNDIPPILRVSQDIIGGRRVGFKRTATQPHRRLGPAPVTPPVGAGVPGKTVQQPGVAPTPPGVAPKQPF